MVLETKEILHYRVIAYYREILELDPPPLNHMTIVVNQLRGRNETS